jgi:hypothetical protein
MRGWCDRVKFLKINNFSYAFIALFNATSVRFDLLPGVRWLNEYNMQLQILFISIMIIEFGMVILLK